MVQNVKLLLLLAICLGLYATSCKAVAAVQSCQALIKIPNYWAEGDGYAASINIVSSTLPVVRMHKFILLVITFFLLVCWVHLCQNQCCI